MPAGIAGDVTRAEHSTIEPQIMDATTPVTVYGVPVKVVSGKIQPMGSGDVGSAIYGLLVRPYPTQNAVSAEALAAATPSTVNAADILRRGYMTVNCANPTSCAKDGQVYFRNLVGSPAGVIGAIDAVDGDNTVELTGATFMGEADADGNVEIAYNI
jgi:hypothetical protein